MRVGAEVAYTGLRGARRVRVGARRAVALLPHERALLGRRRSRRADVDAAEPSARVALAGLIRARAGAVPTRVVVVAGGEANEAERSGAPDGTLCVAVEPVGAPAPETEVAVLGE